MGLEIQWPLVLFTMVAGIGGGILVPAGTAELAGCSNKKSQFTAMVVGMVLLVVGGCFSLLHLASPQNVMAAMFNIFSFSSISMELIFLGICFVVAAVLAIMVKRNAPAGALKVVSAIGIVFSILLLFFCGHGYVMVSRPLWDTNILPLAYLGTSLLGGAFAYGAILVATKAGEAEYKPFKLVALICAIVCAVSCAAYGVAVMDAAMETTPALFWIGVVTCGIVLALALGIATYLKLNADNVARLVAAGLVVAVIAILAVRIVMWDTSAGYLELFDFAAIGSPYASVPLP